MVVAGIASALPMPPALRVLGLAGAAGLLGVSHLADPVGWVVLAVLLVGGLMDSPQPFRRHVAVAVMALCAVVAAKQGAVAWHIPAASATAAGLLGLGFMGAALVLGAPDDPRLGPGTLVGAGLWLAAQGVWLGDAVVSAPVDRAVAVASGRDLQAAAPALQSRVLAALEQGHDAPARAMLSWQRSNIEIGSALATHADAGEALDAGWIPVPPLEASLAIETAWALHARGLGGPGLRLLRGHDGLAAFHGAGLARELGEDDTRFIERAEIPGHVARAPGPVIERQEWVEGGTVEAWVWVPQRMEEVTLVARGTPLEGQPSLVVVVDGTDLGRLSVPESGGRWRWPLAVAPGVVRVSLRFDNDRRGNDGDRNLYDVELALH